MNQSTLEFPSRIGPYRVLNVLGQGGMGVVYQAIDEETGESVALKTVLVPKEGSLRGIRREIQALSRIRHPGIVRILRHGLHEAMPWYAMELLSGRTLRSVGLDWIPWNAELARTRPAGGTLPIFESPTAELGAAELAAPVGSPLPVIDPHSLRAMLTLIRRLCAPLSYLHGEGFVHRDLKPENVLIQEGGMPVLADFGLISRFSAEQGREALELGGAMGTVAYMAPEQIAGGQVDARADLYALGCVLYERLTGRPPFVGVTAGEVARAHLEQAPRAPSSFVAGLPAAVDELVLRLLSKRRGERIGHAEDVAAALAELGAEDGLEAERPMARAYLYRPGLVGRARELGCLYRQVGSLAEGRGGLALIGGESGTGKTRLLVEAAQIGWREGALVLTGECRPGSGLPLEPFRPVLQAIADRCRERGLAAAELLLGRRGKVLAAYEPMLAELPGQAGYPPPPELPAEAARLRLFGDLAETLGALGDGQPLLLALDDLQWADTLSLEFLEFLANSRWLERTRVLVLGSYRAEAVPAGLLGLLGDARVESLRLGPLDGAGIARIVEEMLALRLPPEGLVRFLVRHAEGNPFHVAEYLRGAVQGGLLSRDKSGYWQVAEQAERDVCGSMPLPGSVRELLLRRLEAVPSSARRFLEAAAVLGRAAEPELIQAVAGLASGEALDAPSELVARNLLEATEAGRLQPVHDKMREVAYAGLEPGRRAELHRAAAEALGGWLGLEISKAELGRHWELAGEPLRAAPCYLAAARSARDRYAFVEAEALYGDFLRMSGNPWDAEAFEARFELALNVLHALGRSAQALEQFERALEEARRRGGLDEVEARLLYGQAHVLNDIGEPASARRLYERALSLHPGSAELEAKILQNLAILDRHQGAFPEARGRLERSLELSRRLGEPRLEAKSRAVLGNIAYSEGKLDEARACFLEALALQRGIGDRAGEGSTLNNLAVVEVQSKRFEEAAVLLRQALQIQREAGDRRTEGIALSNLAGIELNLGHWPQARELYDKSLELHRQMGYRRFEASTLVSLASVESRQGRPLEAKELLWQAESIFRQLKDAPRLAVCLCELGQLALELGEPARPFLEQARQLTASLPLGPGSEARLAISKLERALADPCYETRRRTET